MSIDDQFNLWAHYRSEADLYRERALRQKGELTCHKQVAEVLAPYIEPGDTLMDAGCATGYLYWSFTDRGLAVEYHGLDLTARFIEDGREHLCPAAGLPEDRLRTGAVESLTGRYDIVVCVNTLYCVPNYHQPLDRLCAATNKALFIRTLLADQGEYRYLPTDYPGMDPDFRHLKAYYNIYAIDEFTAAISQYGLTPRMVVDERTNDRPEHSRGVSYPWRCVLAVRQ